MEIKVNQLHKSFRDGSGSLTVIENLNFNLASGKSAAIVGRSGVGKSTFLNSLAGLEVPDSGEVIVGDQLITRLGEKELAKFRRDYIGYIFQSPHLFPEFSALENVALPELLHDRKTNRPQELLTKVGLGDRLNHSPLKLSGGEQQRVAIVRALVNQPKLILADEPTGSLDPKTGAEIAKLLIDLTRESAVTMVAVTHNLEFAKLFDYCYEMLPGGGLQLLNK